MKQIYLKRSTREGKKWMVIIDDKKTVHFGAEGYQDYTQHKDKSRQTQYLGRHRSRENWQKSGIDTAGFWSRWLLWSQPTMKGAIQYIEKKFGVKITRGR